MELATYPLDRMFQAQGEARSVTCGSSLKLGLDCHADGTIAVLGIAAHACAVGQASAAVFAGGAMGKNSAEIADAEAALSSWLSDKNGAIPDWPRLKMIAAARAYPARHGAMLLPWRAAVAALVGL